MKLLRHGEKGFSLIELLIVVSILGILATVVVPNVERFVGNQSKVAANTEMLNVKTAAMAYIGVNGVFPTSSANLTSYLSETPDGTYIFNSTTGQITSATAGSGITSDLTFNTTTQQWE